jgi:hypothetical protein
VSTLAQLATARSKWAICFSRNLIFWFMISTMPLNSDVTEQDMKKVIGMAEDKYCPVLSMIKGNTTVETTFTTKKIN